MSVASWLQLEASEVEAEIESTHSIDETEIFKQSLSRHSYNWAHWGLHWPPTVVAWTYRLIINI